MKRWKLSAVAVLLLLAPSGWCAAQGSESKPLVSDRPDFTDGPETVAAGRFQVEAGYTFSRKGDDKENTLGELLLRVGLSQRIELQLGLNSYVWRDSPDGVSQGFDDMSLGVKIKLVEGAESFELTQPTIGVIVRTTLPTGSDDIGEDKPQPEIILALGWDLSERLSLEANLKYAYRSEEGERFNQFAGSLVLNYALTEKLGVFLEYFGLVPESNSGPNASFLHGGLTYLVNDDLQFDIHAGFGINQTDPNYFAGVGVSWRY